MYLYENIEEYFFFKNQFFLIFHFCISHCGAGAPGNGNVGGNQNNDNIPWMTDQGSGSEASDSEAAADSGLGTVSAQVEEERLGGRARRQLDRALEADPRHWRSLRLRGAIREQAGEQQGACEDYRHSLGLQPNQPLLSQALAQRCPG